jgi:hypothetical protein
MIAGRNGPAVALDNPASQGQAEPGAFDSSGVEGLENSLLFARCDAFTPVANFDDKVAIRLNVEVNINGQRG